VSEAGLLQRASEGDETAFRELYYLYRDRLFRFAYRFTGSTAAAEDIVQQCFTVLIQNLHRYDSRRGSLGPYLFGIVRKLTAKWRNGAGRELSGELAAELPARDPPEQDLLDREAASWVRSAVLALPPQQREVVILRDFEQLSIDEIAELLGVNPGVVKARLHRGRAGLRRALQRYRGSRGGQP